MFILLRMNLKNRRRFLTNKDSKIVNKPFIFEIETFKINYYLMVFNNPQNLALYLIILKTAMLLKKHIKNMGFHQYVFLTTLLKSIVTELPDGWLAVMKFF